MTALAEKTLIEEILRARERVYHVNGPTPLEQSDIPGLDAEVYLKREDLSAINAYKWRGAYNAIAVLPEEARKLPVIAASAGNHAQGVALAARRLGLRARIYMPRSTPEMKRLSVARHGGEAVEIILKGDSYDEASIAAMAEANSTGAAYIHPYDNLHTIAGQATIADEIALSGKGPFDFAFLQIGGGGLAAGVSFWLRLHYPGIRLFGVEARGQAAMKASLDAGHPVTLDHVDRFCDGTAVRRPGDLCFAICRDTLEDVVTVENDEVSAAMETTWRAGRYIPEPSGALGLAGMIAYARAHPEAVRGRKLLGLICGANMDFSKLRLISAGSALGAHRQRWLRIEIDERGGSLLELIENSFSEFDIVGFHYGKLNAKRAWPAIAVSGEPAAIESALARLRAEGRRVDDLTGEVDMRFRVINYDPRLLQNPVFHQVEFPERAGALHELLRAISGMANICYFNYVHTGEEIGRALMGFELADEADEQRLIALAAGCGVALAPISEAARTRLLRSE